MNNKLLGIIHRGDGYKYSHYMLYPNGITNNNSYIESRGIDKDDVLPAGAQMVFFGLQVFLKKYLSEPVTLENIMRVERMITQYGLPFNADDWKILVNEYDGKLPLVVYAVPEGTVMSPKNVMVQVRATDNRFAWLASFVETVLLRAIWYPTTVATLSREAKKVIKQFLDETAEPEAANGALPFRLHDFGARGASSAETAELGGMAHLINFLGTDTVEALFAAEDYYNAVGPIGFSIPASEHSTITAWGREREVNAFSNMIDVFGGEGKLFSCVSDSYDIYDAVTNKFGVTLKDKVINNGGTLVIRPDSGDPIETPVWVVQELDRVFGSTVNELGFKVLHPAVRVIQGDGINLDSIRSILQKLKDLGYSAENIAFGMGGALLQKVNRDTAKFAMKTNAVEIDNEWKDVYKQPIGSEFKKSKAGVLALVVRNDEYVTIRQDEMLPGEENKLVKVWENGELLVDDVFDAIRGRASL